MIRTEAEFVGLRREWNDLLAASDADCLFLTWEWLYSWWEHLSAGRQLNILAVRNDGQLVAIAPLAVRPRQPERLFPFRALEFLGAGSVGSDYLDLIVRKGEEEPAQRVLAGYLTNCSYMLEFPQLKVGSGFAAGLASKLVDEGWSISQVETHVCPYIELAGRDWEAYVSSLGASHRRNLRRRIKNLYRTFNVEWSTAANEPQRAAYFEVFLDLHYRRWQTREGSNALKDSTFVEFHENFSRRALERGWLRLSILRLDGKPAAAVYGFRYKDVFYYYQAGFDPAYAEFSVGLASLGFSIMHAIGEGGMRIYDLLHGDEAYKSLWARDELRLCRMNLYPRNIQGWLSHAATGLRLGIKWALGRRHQALSQASRHLPLAEEAADKGSA